MMSTLQKIFLLTIDCDLRCDDVGLRQASLDKLLEVFNNTGVRGHVTWFLNENDFAITKNHKSFLKEIVKNKDTLAIHDHIDWLKGNWSREKIREYCSKSKKTVEEWMTYNGYSKKIIFHRTGCLFQRPSVYHALKDLEYTVVSDIFPGYKGENHTGFLACDNRFISDGIKPYRHDEENFLDCQSHKGYFLQIPIVNMGLNPNLYEYTYLDFKKVSMWIHLSERKKSDICVLTLIFHPYEIMNTCWKNSERTRIDNKIVKLLEEDIQRCVSEYKLTFANMEECYKEIKKLKEV